MTPLGQRVDRAHRALVDSNQNDVTGTSFLRLLASYRDAVREQAFAQAVQAVQEEAARTGVRR